MQTREVMQLMQVFVSISDSRSARQVRHDLSELLMVAMCTVLCSADEFSDIEAWAKECIDWLRGFLMLEHGIPSNVVLAVDSSVARCFIRRIHELG